MDMQRKLDRSQSYFNHFNLSFYDMVVAVLSPLAWRVPVSLLEQRHRQMMSDNHLEVGPGTGRLLAKIGSSGSPGRLVLMDLSDACLEISSNRLSHLGGTVRRQDLLKPLERPLVKFDSIAIDYVLHCVPGNFRQKQVAFETLSTLLNPGGTIFGCTVLGLGSEANLLAKATIKCLQRRGIFLNQSDNADELRAVLEDCFDDVQVEVSGPTALFSAKGR